MLVRGSIKSQEITSDGIFKEQNIVSPVFYNAGGTGVTVKRLPISSTTPYAGWVNDHILLDDEEFEIKFTDPTNKQNKLLVFYHKVKIDIPVDNC